MAKTPMVHSAEVAFDTVCIRVGRLIQTIHFNVALGKCGRGQYTLPPWSKLSILKCDLPPIR